MSEDIHNSLFISIVHINFPEFSQPLSVEVRLCKHGKSTIAFMK